MVCLDPFFVQVPVTATELPTAIGASKVGGAVQVAPTELIPEPVMLIGDCAFTTDCHADAAVVDASSMPYISERLPCNAELGEVTVVAAILIEVGEPIADKGTYQS